MNPYSSLSSDAFWKTAVAQRSMYDLTDLWDPKFNILQSDKVSTYGSCFAQHIGRALRSRDYNWFITELAPEVVSEELSIKYNYGVFTSRTANIYTATLLEQWISWSLDPKLVPDEIWEVDGRIYDPFRPTIEPNGFSSVEEMKRSRLHTLQSFKKSVVGSDVFVFTLGLTECWRNVDFGYEYPLCPGTVCGEFDSTKHEFVNLDYVQTYDALLRSINLMRNVNPGIRILLTVSPVPLVATASGVHVLLATTYSKSVLRACAGMLSASFDDIDYFPSFEVVNSPPFRGSFFEPNQRGVNQYGVNFIMDMFFKCLNSKYSPGDVEGGRGEGLVDLICEEELLCAFGGGR